MSLGLPLYLKGHASAWFNTLPTPDEMSFDELSEELVTHFGSGASEWRVRQALGHRRQLEKESVADYSYQGPKGGVPGALEPCIFKAGALEP